MSEKKNRVFSNGLYLLNIKKKTNDFVILALTDFNDTGRFMFDKLNKKIIGGHSDIKFNASDISLIEENIKILDKV